MFLKLEPRRRSVTLAHLVPNLITTVALCCGLASLHYATREEWERAMAAVALSAVFDSLDGRAARLLRVSSDFGAVLDSLSDFVAFGVAPALILHQWILAPVDTWGLAAVTTFALCAGLRLSRFTAAAPAAKADSSKPDAKADAKADPTRGNYFAGMPTPAAAGAVLVPAMLTQARIVDVAIPQAVVVGYTLLIAILMISRVPMFSFKKLRINRRFVAPLLVAVGLFVILLFKDPWLTISAVAFAYLCSAPLSAWMRHRARAAMTRDLPGTSPMTIESVEPDPVRLAP